MPPLLHNNNNNYIQSGPFTLSGLTLTIVKHHNSATCVIAGILQSLLKLSRLGLGLIEIWIFEPAPEPS
jgi:hypothetical protein